jgi:ferredoxin-NADP reductase
MLRTIRTSAAHTLRFIHTKPALHLFRPRITNITEPVPNVRTLELDISATPDFTFFPGQWLDVHVTDRNTGEPLVTGFSITSAPLQQLEQKKLHLAVKKTFHPISRCVVLLTN